MDDDSPVARAFLKAREQFAQQKTNRKAAALLRAAKNACVADLIDEDEQDEVLSDVIDYLEERD